MFKVFNKNSKKSIPSNKGSMMLEVLVAASIIAMSVLAASNVAQKSIGASRQAFHSTQASFLLEEGAEAIRVYRDNAWGNLSAMTVGTDYYPSFSGSTWTFSTTPSTVGNFTRKVVLSNVYRDSSSQDIVSSGGTLDSGTKLVTVTVSWNQGGKVVTKTLSFYLADIFS